jgi:kynurenine formamidase
LNLTSVPAGRHHLTCLPLLLMGSDGSPARCVLTHGTL